MSGEDRNRIAGRAVKRGRSVRQAASGMWCAAAVAAAVRVERPAPEARGGAPARAAWGGAGRARGPVATRRCRCRSGTSAGGEGAPLRALRRSAPSALRKFAARLITHRVRSLFAHPLPWPHRLARRRRRRSPAPFHALLAVPADLQQTL